MSKIIFIKYKTQVFECLVSEEDYPYLIQYNWIYRCGYAGRQKLAKEKYPGSTLWVHLHRVVLERQGIKIEQGQCVDHINRNKMDNRRENLRAVSHSINSKNISNEALQRRQKCVQTATLASALKPRTKKQLQNAKKAVEHINKNKLNRHYGKDNYISKKVIDTNTNIVYASIKEAAKALNLNYNTLKCKLNGNLKNNTTLRFYHI